MDGRTAGSYQQLQAMFAGLWTRVKRRPSRNEYLAAPSILKPYARPGRRWYVPSRAWLLVPLLFLFCVIYGFAFALLAPFIVVPFAIPILVLLLLVIWVMPDAAAPERALNFFFFAFFIGLIAWPNYISIALPGLPWISIIRLTVFPMTILLLYSLSVSKSFRETLYDTLSSTSPVWKIFVAFVAIQAISVGVSKSPFFSLNKLVVYETEWTAIFFTACFVFLKPGRATKWAACIWGLALWVGAIGLWENRLGYVPWRNHIPSIFQIDDPVVQGFLAGSQRSATGIHRVQSVFTSSLSLSQYLAVALPFSFYFSGRKFHWLIRLAAMATIPSSLYVIILTDSRLGVVGFLVTLMSLLFIWAFRQRNQSKTNPFWTAIVASYPLIFGLAVASTFFVGRIRARVWGNGPQQFSTQSRIEQYHLGIPKILTHPWGYGVGNGNDALGFADNGGFSTIDSYYLLIGLEYGILGFLFFFGTILLALYAAGKIVLSNRALKGELDLLIPASVSILTFFVIMSVFAQPDNNPILFMLLGMITALICRIRSSEKDDLRLAATTS